MGLSETTPLRSVQDYTKVEKQREKELERPKWTVGYIVHALVVSIFLVPVHVISMCICWFFIVTIPMSKLNRKMILHLYNDYPLDLRVQNEYPGAGAELLLVTYSTCNAYYFKYQVGGMNVILVNLMVFVVITLVLSYGVPKSMKPPDEAMLGIALVSTIPLTYYIGTALASLSAQTSIAVGAVLTAGFGSIIELILYCSMILKGGLERTIQAGIIGTLLGTLLLLPGLAMVKFQTFSSFCFSMFSNILGPLRQKLTYILDFGLCEISEF